MANPLPKPWTVEDFIAWEAQEPERYEFIDGIVFMMTGGSIAHTVIRGNVYVALRSRLRNGPCRPLVDGPKVISGSASFYPDATVTCTPVDPADDRIREPVVIVEVLSRSTSDRDRGRKWVAYQGIPSLRHYVLIAQDERRVEVFSRRETEWSFQVLMPPSSTVALPAIGIELTLDEIYEDSGT